MRPVDRRASAATRPTAHRHQVAGPADPEHVDGEAGRAAELQADRSADGEPQRRAERAGRRDRSRPAIVGEIG